MEQMEHQLLAEMVEQDQVHLHYQVVHSEAEVVEPLIVQAVLQDLVDQEVAEQEPMQVAME